MELQLSDRKLFPRTWAALEKGIEEKVAPGMVLGFWDAKNPNHPAQAFVAGQSRIEPTAQPLTVDSVFDIASVSKVLATATLMAVMIEKGWLDWETSVSSILEDFPHKDVQVVHLASHSSGQLWWSPFYEELRKKALHQGTDLWTVPFEIRQKWMRDLVFSQPLISKPGDKFVYSDLAFMTLGFLLEEITGMKLDQAVSEWVWKPMGLKASHYRRISESAVDFSSSQLALSYVATESCPWRAAVLQGQVHDDNCWSMGGIAGHAGVFSDLRDLMTFSSCWLKNFIPDSVRRVAWSAVSPPWGPLDSFRTPGWDMPGGLAPAIGQYFSKRSVGHLGFTGTSLWIDPDHGIAVALLTNRVHPSRANDRIKGFRPNLHDALAQDLKTNCML